MNNVKLEYELYKPMRDWLYDYLNDKYKDQKCSIKVLDTHTKYLDAVLDENDIIKFYPNIVGLGIQIDVLGIVIFENKADLFFIEAKKNQLNLHDLGQIIVYCELCEPKNAWLLSSAGLGSLDKTLKNLNRTDLLIYGNNQFISVAKWDVQRKTVDQHSMVTVNTK